MIINRVLLAEERQIKFIFMWWSEDLCLDYASDCIDVEDFALCASGGCCYPPAIGVCPMIALL